MWVVLASFIVGGAVLLALLLRSLDKASDSSFDKWYTRIDKFPSTKALVLLGMASFIVSGWVVAGNAIYFAVTKQTPSHEFVDAMDTWLDKVLFVMGIGTAHFVGKRATTKPELENNDGQATSAPEGNSSQQKS
jgi:hypothetical protein